MIDAGVIAVTREQARTGGEGGRRLGPPDTPARRLLAYMLVRFMYVAFKAVMRLLPTDHPFRVAYASAVERLWATCSQYPRLGILPIGGTEVRMTTTTKRLWKVVMIIVAALLVSDAFAFGPIDLGLIPDIHIGVGQLLHIPWRNDTHMHLFDDNVIWRNGHLAFVSILHHARSVTPGS